MGNFLVCMCLLKLRNNLTLRDQQHVGAFPSPIPQSCNLRSRVFMLNIGTLLIGEKVYFLLVIRSVDWVVHITLERWWFHRVARAQSKYSTRLSKIVCCFAVFLSPALAIIVLYSPSIASDYTVQVGRLNFLWFFIILFICNRLCCLLV